ncbi:hypothetical protein [Streptomyces sp. ICBB 8177]|uniref:hypothetical protein n=1 Tax=Streptomyces sp. ICBB 8177 TaxID=563922 RepID=UPI000D672B97|nr:hypothetical protein [Streptomyces sp. ICBB 8177]PWI43717.1 hypothetical protein CK485_16545 [Streptomyces sp. ICBB 8177]
MFTRSSWARVIAASGVAIGTIAAAVPAYADDAASDPDVVINCVAWNDHGDNIGDNVFYVNAKTPASSEVMPIDGTQITCTNLPSNTDPVRITPGPDTSLGELGDGFELTPGQTQNTFPTPAHPHDDVVLTVTRVPADAN